VAARREVRVASAGDKRLREVAMHESGHYVVGEVLGFAMRSLRFERDGNAGSEGGFMRTLKSINEVKELIEQRIQVLYAGCLAESLEAMMCGQTTAHVAWKGRRSRTGQK
jgi:ATP-dependent Zn protease